MQTTIFHGFHQIFSKKLQKVWDFVKNYQNLKSWPKLATFRSNYHVLGFSSRFQKKVPESMRFCEKLSKLVDLVKTSNFSYKIPCFRFFYKVFSKKLQTVSDFLNNHHSCQFGQSYYHVLGSSSSFQQKFARTMTVCKKPSKLVDSAESSNFSGKLLCFRVFMKFSAKFGQD